MDPLQVLLVDNTKEEEDVCVNMDLIRLGLARLCATENSSKEPPNSLQQTGEIWIAHTTDSRIFEMNIV